MIRLVLYALLARIFARLLLVAFGTPTDPTPGTVITSAFAVANFLDPIRALRAFTGGADPPGSGYVVESSSTSATSWVLVNAAKIASWLGYTPVNKAGDTLTGELLQSGGNGYTLGATSGTKGRLYDVTGSQTVMRSHNDVFGVWSANLTQNFLALTASLATFLGGISATTAAFSGALSAASAAIAGTMSANAIAVTSTTEVANLNAAALSGADWHAGLTGENTAGQTPDAGGAFTDVTSCSVTLDRAGTWLILATMSWTTSVGGGGGEVRIVVNGAAQTPMARTPTDQAIGPIGASTFTTISASNGHVAKLQMRQTGVGAGLNNARIVAIWLAP